MANIKISELTAETELSDNHILITEQENATETKKSTLGLIFDWIVGKLPIATADKAGNIKSGGDITVDTNGAVTVNSVGGKTVKADVPENAVFTDTVYELPVASDAELGGIKVDGDTITVDENGVAHAKDGGLEIIDTIPENPETNILYKYTDTLLGDILMMYMDGHWRYSPLLMYPQKVFISPTEIYATGHITNGTSTPADAISLVDLAEPLQIENLIATQAVKIYGQDLNNIEYGWTFNFDIPQDAMLGEKYLYIGVSGEGSTYDYAKVIINNGTETSYQPASKTLGKYAIPLDTLVAGSNEITVKYVKDNSNAALDDCVYIYGVDYLYTI